MNINKAFSTKTNPAAFDIFTKNQAIPDHLRSCLAAKLAQGSSVIGLGVVAAVTRALTDDAKVCKDNDRFIVEYTDNEGILIKVVCEYTGQRTWYSSDLDDTLLPYIAVLIESLGFGLHDPEIVIRYEKLYRDLAADTNNIMTEASIQAVCSKLLHQENMMALTDALYYNLRDTMTEVKEIDHLMAFQETLVENFWRVKPLVVSPNAKPITNGHQKIEQLIESGSSILLTGPTGTFKTETAKRATVATGRSMIVIKGMPGLEDRDLIGGITRTTGDPKWVDGPLTKAFRLAQSQKVCLIVDELLRFEAYYQAIFIGALDELAVDELNSMGLQALADERHRMLTLFNGETLIAPVSNLSIIATTNLGDEYIQAGGRIDGALLGRFNAIIDFKYADEKVALALYEAVAVNKAAALAAFEVEKFTRAKTVMDSGTLQRELNPRVVKNWLEQHARNIKAGAPATIAFLEAAEYTVIPFCVPRDSYGQLEETAKSSLMDEIRKYAKGI
jgi:MoxR-like ATPase